MPILRLFALVAMLAGAVLLAGCAGALHDTDYLGSYEDFNHVEKKNLGFRLLSEDEDHSLDQYFLTRAQLRELEAEEKAPPSLEADGIDPESLQPVLFIVTQPEWRTPRTLSNEEEHAEVIFVVRERLYRYLLREYPHPARARYAWYPDDPVVQGYRVLEVRTAVTDIRRGSGLMRYILGYGAGSAVLQLEGRVVDVTGTQDGEDGEVVAEFATRIAHGAYPNGFLNPSVIRDEYALMYGAELAVRRLVPLVRETVPVAQPLGADPAIGGTAAR